MGTFEEITAGVYRISSGRSNSYLLSGDELTLVDTGMPGEAEEIIENIRKIGRRCEDLNYILITHAHMDHMGSVAALKKASGARVVASKREVEYIEGLSKTWTMGREGPAGKVFKGVLFLLETFYFRYEPVSVEIPCHGGEVIDCFGGIKVISSPGHSPGSLSFYQGEKRIIFTGDALSGMPQLKLPPRFGCANYREAMASVHKIAELDFDACFFGHGEPLKKEASQAVRGLLKTD
jgi:glyoxylase-like metal-dependent hydrolase (beta-lactamase superfamily II)